MQRQTELHSKPPGQTPVEPQQTPSVWILQYGEPGQHCDREGQHPVSCRGEVSASDLKLLRLYAAPTSSTRVIRADRLTRARYVSCVHTSALGEESSIGPFGNQLTSIEGIEPAGDEYLIGGVPSISPGTRGYSRDTTESSHLATCRSKKATALRKERRSLCCLD
ncbi:hypothetical protein VC83_02673 [Pseudogymnoascus destructans]|uniref:Uncharacterized protein n=1 Tax=Pseudogymnoascus destructans TaxID=655981 RepID=A0A177AGR0_9PEZI|nr:uncharacterized protein VC83_02673 [Pseudogymnoascus destructans]OAF60990.1 hypothetical protein VC83_02673 [Pseudogymnoascus destructans]